MAFVYYSVTVKRTESGPEAGAVAESTPASSPSSTPAGSAASAGSSATGSTSASAKALGLPSAETTLAILKKRYGDITPVYDSTPLNKAIEYIQGALGASITSSSAATKYLSIVAAAAGAVYVFHDLAKNPLVDIDPARYTWKAIDEALAGLFAESNLEYDSKYAEPLKYVVTSSDAESAMKKVLPLRDIASYLYAAEKESKMDEARRLWSKYINALAEAYNALPSKIVETLCVEYGVCSTADLNIYKAFVDLDEYVHTSEDVQKLPDVLNTLESIVRDLERAASPTSAWSRDELEQLLNRYYSVRDEAVRRADAIKSFAVKHCVDTSGKSGLAASVVKNYCTQLWDMVRKTEDLVKKGDEYADKVRQKLGG